MLKRYSVTLTDEKATHAKKLIKELKLRPNAFSKMLDRHLSLIISTLEDCAEKKLAGEKFSLDESMRRVVFQDELPL